MKKKILKELIIQTNLWKTPKQSVNLKKKEIRKFTNDYSKNIAKKRKKQRINLELKLKNLDSNLNSRENRKLYSHYKNALETMLMA